MEKTFIKRIIYTFIAFLLMYVSWFIFQLGIIQIKDTRYMSRIPVAPISAMIKGDYLIHGKTTLNQSKLSTPYSNSEALLYIYNKSELRKDFEGKKYWATIESSVNVVDFYLEDVSGKTLISIPTTQIKESSIDFTNIIDIEVGGYRYIEKWVAVNEDLIIYGKKSNSELNIFTIAPFSNNNYFIESGLDGNYLQTTAINGILLIVLGLTMVSISIVFLFVALKQHRIIGFLTVLCIVNILILLMVGNTLIKKDMIQSVENLKEQYLNIQSINQDIHPESISYYKQLYSNVYYQMNKFPSRYIARANAIELPDSDFTVIQNNIKKFELINKDLIMILIACFISFFIFLWVGMRYTLAKRQIENIPTSKIKGLMMGVSEVKGTSAVHNGEYLTSPLTSTKCCWFHYVVEEYRNDEWVRVGNLEECSLFKCYDDSGSDVLINPAKSEISSKYMNQETINDDRYTEVIIPFGKEIYVLGDVCMGAATGKPMLKNTQDQNLIITTFSEFNIVNSKSLVAMCFMTGVFCVSILFGLLSLAKVGSYDPVNYVIISLCIPLFLIILMSICHYNDILFLRNRVERNFANIQVMLKKRYDLFRSINKVVKQSLKHEKKLLTAITSLRSNYKVLINNGEKITANHLEKITGQDVKVQAYLKVIAEEYPDLKSNNVIQNYIKIQTEVEDEIGFIRDGYNDAVNKYNERIQTFPDVLLAKWFGFVRKKYF